MIADLRARRLLRWRNAPRLPILPRAGWSGQIAAATLLLIVLAVIAGPLIWTVDPEQTNLSGKFAPPNGAAPLGTDEYGRDLLSRLLHGGRLSLLGALAVLLGSSSIGLIVGAIAGGLGRWVDRIVSRLIDGLLALPTLIVALAIVGLLGKSYTNLLIALIITSWPWYARVYRGLIQSERSQLYVLAAHTVGVSAQRIIWRHIGPNVRGPILILATANLGNALLSLTALSFLGLGVQPPRAEWGAMINSARVHFQTEPWVMIVPGLAIGVTVIAVNLLGDTLRDLADPRRRARH